MQTLLFFTFSCPIHVHENPAKDTILHISNLVHGNDRMKSRTNDAEPLLLFSCKPLVLPSCTWAIDFHLLFLLP